MRRNGFYFIFSLTVVVYASIVSGVVFASEAQEGAAKISGELKKWHTVTLTLAGPECSEDSDPNPFLDYRMAVTFTQGDKKLIVPGYFAADGNAAESGASKGNRWRAHFTPDTTGEWAYEVSFLAGKDAALNPQNDAGEPMAPNGVKGQFSIENTDKQAPDFRARGRLEYVGKTYLRFTETGEYYIKGGADSPENFLAYYEFDQTPKNKQTQAREGEAKPVSSHYYQPHAYDWKPGDPTWREGKGKNIIGALNYLASQSMNSVYFLTMNVEGDGKDVWPWTGPNERFRFDCSKLDQWSIVFSHMQNLGLLMHVLTQETENDQLLDGGELGPERKLYYRELIARFGHHLALVWNLGEENTNTTEQLKAYCDYIRSLDAYQHPIVVHTYPGDYEKVYQPLAGFTELEGPSLQMGDMKETHAETIKWLDRSVQAGHPWFVCLDEIGPAEIGVKPDADDPEHNEARHHALWGNLMAGGAGVEWYFGYKFAHNDLNMEDWRSRENMWKQTRIALEFFHEYLPFTEMKHNDELTSAEGDYCFAKPGEVYAIYLPQGGETNLQLAEGNYRVQWFDPRNGGDLQEGSVDAVQSRGNPSLGRPPKEVDRDWVVLVKKQ